jgi:hypothetical protein
VLSPHCVLLDDVEIGLEPGIQHPAPAPAPPG